MGREQEKQSVMESQPNQAEELKVFISSQESVCHECAEKLEPQTWITLAGENKVSCLACADLEHLIFLPSGDAALTRRAKKHSTLSAVVLQWSRRRKRYERQGLLVGEAGLAKAEEECLADNEVRERRREREAVRREAVDRQYLEMFSRRVRELFPGCPDNREVEIAEHACLKYSGRVGRSASAKSLDVAAVRLAVAAHIRHRETEYDRLLAAGVERREARAIVKSAINEILSGWEK
jgi:hypothetical protein